jgi:hypothetical protein
MRRAMGFVVLLEQPPSRGPASSSRLSKTTTAGVVMTSRSWTAKGSWCSTWGRATSRFRKTREAADSLAAPDSRGRSQCAGERAVAGGVPATAAPALEPAGSASASPPVTARRA